MSCFDGVVDSSREIGNIKNMRENMYKTILVPLDGSELAECVLPHVEGFMENCRVRKENNYMLKKNSNSNQFDFDRGHIIKSPCRECELKNRLPRCSENCRKLGRLQALLVGCVSCSNSFHNTDAYSISYGNN